jgi:serine/threonine-protein kinase
MSKENEVRTSGMDVPDVTSDPLIYRLDDHVEEMLLRKNMAWLFELDDADLERLSEESLGQLTDEDVQVVDSLGSSEEFIDEVIAAASECELDELQAEVPTLRNGGETTAEPGSEFQIAASIEEPGPVSNQAHPHGREERIVFRSEYRKTTELGRGGQGIVYLAEGEDDFAATHALKIFAPQAYDSRASFVEDMERMKPIASIIHHDPHDDLVDIGWFGEHADSYAMLMQYIDGYDLAYLTKPELKQDLERCVDVKRWQTITDVVYSINGGQQLALKPAIAVYIIERVLRGLAALHKRGIVHGDIKPSNIMLNASGSVKIIDIGSAFEADAPPKSHYVTPAYSAPEFLSSRVMTRQSDLASVGYVLIELLSGKTLTGGKRDADESTRTIGGKEKTELLDAKLSLPHRLSQILPEDVQKSSHLVELCRRLIDPDLSQRFPTAADTIVDSKGTYQFNKDLILSNLGVCNFQEVSQWLADVKDATRWVRGAPSFQR